MQDIQVRSLGQEDPLEKEMETHSSTFAWRIPWTEEPGRLKSMRLQRVGHDLMTEHTHILFGSTFQKATTPGNERVTLARMSFHQVM